MKRKKLKPRKSRLVISLITSAVVAVSGLGIWTDKAVRPVAEKQAEHLSVTVTNQVIEETVSEYLTENNFSYGDFVGIKYDSSGHTASVVAVTQNINRVQSELAVTINKRLENTQDYAYIPVGSLTGSYMLAGKGFKIKLRICPAQKVTVRLKSDFTSAGNNQTCHRISAEVTAQINSSLPIYDFETETQFEFLLAESIIVGEVPDIVMN